MVSQSTTAVLLFSKLQKYFLDTLIRRIFFQIMKINNFRGELTDTSAIKEALDYRCYISSGRGANSRRANRSSSKNEALSVLPPKKRPCKLTTAFVADSMRSSSTKIRTYTTRESVNMCRTIPFLKKGKKEKDTLDKPTLTNHSFFERFNSIRLYRDCFIQ